MKLGNFTGPRNRQHHHLVVSYVLHLVKWSLFYSILIINLFNFRPDVEIVLLQDPTCVLVACINRQQIACIETGDGKQAHTLVMGKAHTSNAADSITSWSILWITFLFCFVLLCHLMHLTFWYVSFREASEIILGHVGMWLTQAVSLSHTWAIYSAVVKYIKIFLLYFARKMRNGCINLLKRLQKFI